MRELLVEWRVSVVEDVEEARIRTTEQKPTTVSARKSAEGNGDFI